MSVVMEEIPTTLDIRFPGINFDRYPPETIAQINSAFLVKLLFETRYPEKNYLSGSEFGRIVKNHSVNFCIEISTALDSFVQLTPGQCTSTLFTSEHGATEAGPIPSSLFQGSIPKEHAVSSNGISYNKKRSTGKMRDSFSTTLSSRGEFVSSNNFVFRFNNVHSQLTSQWGKRKFIFCFELDLTAQISHPSFPSPLTSPVHFVIHSLPWLGVARNDNHTRTSSTGSEQQSSPTLGGVSAGGGAGEGSSPLALPPPQPALPPPRLTRSAAEAQSARLSAAPPLSMFSIAHTQKHKVPAPKSLGFSSGGPPPPPLTRSASAALQNVSRAPTGPVASQLGGMARGGGVVMPPLAMPSPMEMKLMTELATVTADNVRLKQRVEQLESILAELLSPFPESDEDNGQNRQDAGQQTAMATEPVWSLLALTNSGSTNPPAEPRSI